MVSVGSALAYTELTLLVFLTLTLALQPLLPVPRVWAVVAGALLVVQTAAVRGMAIEPYVPSEGVKRWESLDSLAEVVGILVVPACTTMVLIVAFYHLARANARARKRLARALADARETGRPRPSGATGPPAAGPQPGRGPGAPAAPPA